jgi:DNA-binding NtrC family response regulator
MSRFSLRVQKPVQAAMIFPDGKERQVDLKNIGLGGVYLRSGNLKPQSAFGANSFHGIRVSLNSLGDIFLTTQVVRNGNKGVGLRFSKISQTELIKIWQFIRDDIKQPETCPYCNTAVDGLSSYCSFCGWKLDFKDKDYLAYWERESLMRSMLEGLKELPTNKLRDVVRNLNGQLRILSSSAEVEEIEEFVGTCPGMMKVFKLIPKVGPTDLPVLILGESGTGKELTARAIHERSDRSDGPFVAINCAAIPEHLLESELFGHCKGAFTGAYKEKKGKFEYADHGTLFLDEIGEFPLELQPKLLRFLETQQIESVGGYQRKRLDVRILAATNRNLERAIDRGQFRPDLYYRIKVFTIDLPPLRDRGEDKVILANYFLKRIKTADAWACNGFSPEALDAIRTHTWPGNVRELINRIRRALVVQDQWIRPRDLELKDQKKVGGNLRLKAAKDQLKKELIEKTLKENQFNITRTAKHLGISRQHLYVLKKKLDIEIPSRRKTA